MVKIDRSSRQVIAAITSANLAIIVIAPKPGRWSHRVTTKPEPGFLEQNNGYIIHTRTTTTTRATDLIAREMGAYVSDRTEPGLNALDTRQQRFLRRH